MHEVPQLAWIAALPVGAISTAILVVNNLRDRHTDVKANKRTLAVRFGRRFAEVEYILLMLIAYLTPLGIYGSREDGSLWILLPMLSLPIGITLTADVLRLEGSPLNQTLAKTAKLLLVFGILWSLGLAMPALTL